MAVNSTEPGPSPVLRRKTFLWAGDNSQVLSQLSSLQNGYSLGSADDPEADATVGLLLAIPDWSATNLGSPWLIDQSLFPGLASAMGGSSGPISTPISLLGSALAVEPVGDVAVLALLAEADGAAPQTLLIGLGGLASEPSIDWSTLLPDEQIHRLLLSETAAGTTLITVGTSQVGDGAISTRYPLQATGLGEIGGRTYLAGSTDIQAKATDGALTPSIDGTTLPTLVQVGLASAPTTTGLIPSGGTDVLVSALDEEGNLLWERLFGNKSIEQQPRLAMRTDGTVVVGATLQGSLGLNPAAGGLDIGLASYGPDGSLIWRRLLGDAGNQSITDLTVAPDGTVLVLGLTSASAQGLYGQAVLGDGSDVDSFITAYSPQGDRLWTHQFGSSGEDLALAMDWMALTSGDEGQSTNTLVVVGSQATTADPESPRAWVELLELQATADVEEKLIPPASPSIDWGTGNVDPTLGIALAVIRRGAGTTPQLLLQGNGEPGSSVQVRTSLSQAATTANADSSTGRWTVTLELPNLTESQLGQGFVLLEARNTQGLASDVTAVPVLFTGTGLPGDLPQMLAIDPDGVSGAQPPALLQRQITALGDGPLTVAGQRLLVDYSGTLTNGTAFDSSLNPGRSPFDLTLGAGRVITGWDQGLQGLPMGSQVRLVIPPSLAYGERATGSIPTNSTLVFDVDLRADLSIPELFLRDLVWPEFFAANATNYTNTNDSLLESFGLDLLGLALRVGPGDGTANGDAINLSPVAGFPDSYPLLAMGGGGNDVLAASGQQASVLFGEAGDDQLRSAEAAYAFLDGGSGNDRLESGALISWLSGGSGVDTVAIPTGDWRLQRSGTVGDDTWRELGRFDAAGQLLQLLQLQGVERLSLVGTTAKASDLLRLLDDLTTEVVDAAALSAINGSAVELKQLYAAAKAGRISGLGNESLTVDPGTAAAADLLELAGVTTINVNANAVTTLTGSAAAIQAAITATSIDTAASVGIRVDSGSATVAQANAIAAATTGVITATISDGTIAALANLTGTGNAYALTVTDPTVNADALNTLDGKTTITVNANAVTTLTGTAAAIQAAITATSIDTASSVGVTVDSGSSSASDLIAIDGATTATVNANAVTALTGTASERNQVFQAQGLKLSLPDDQAPALLQVSTTAGSYGPNRTISLTLHFDEPVRWQNQNPGVVPVLQLSNGLSAAWVPPALGSQGATEQRFDLLTGSHPPSVSQLQVLGLAGLDQFSDAAGNALAMPQAEAWRLSQTVKLSPWNLDVDADGSVTPLGDGLMIIRKLFVSAFPGEALTAKAVSPQASRSTSEIHAYIQQGIDQGLLDVDRDGGTTPLGDGLMVIRQLFGTAFSGESLINKAIGETSSLIPQGQTLTSLDAAGRLTLANQVRQQISALLP